MLKRLLTELRCKLMITTTGPVLVKSGHASVMGPDMTPVRTYRRGGEEEVYLPGSSLKGVIRSHLEKVCRTLWPRLVCNPFVTADEKAEVKGKGLQCGDYFEVACSDKFEMRKKGQLRLKNNTSWVRAKEPLENDSATAYADSCPICRLFGSTSFIGRLSIGDAYLTVPERTENRDGVGIDRLTGGAAHGAKFDLETVSPGVAFEAEILLRNFECWQIGMLLVAVADLRDELVRIGSGRSRGFGAVKGHVEEVTLFTLGAQPGKRVGEVWGLGKFHSPAERQVYGTFPDDALLVTPAPAEGATGLRHKATFTGPSLSALETASREKFVQQLEGWPVRKGVLWPSDWKPEGKQ